MNRIIIVASACSLLAGAAVAETLGEKMGVNSTLGIAPTTQDFVKEAAVGDMFEIQSSKEAADKLTGPSKDFANQMITDHTKTTEELSAQAKADNIPIPTAMDSVHQQMLDKMNGLSGDNFRKQYLNDQVSAHRDAVSLFERYGKGGDNAKLKQWASQTLPVLQHHLQMAENLDK